MALLYARQEDSETLRVSLEDTDMQYTVSTLYELWTVIRITAVDRVIFTQPNGRSKIVRVHNGNLMKAVYNKAVNNKWFAT